MEVTIEELTGEVTKVDIVTVGGSPVYSFNGIPVNVREK